MLPLVIVLSVALIVLVVLVVLRERTAATYRAQYTATSADVKAARAHSIATSKATTRGLAVEQLAPFFPDMVAHFAPSDWRFLGSPVDFVVFDGLERDEVTRLVLVEVKSGKDARLNRRQAALRAAVDAGRVDLSWLTVRAPTPPIGERPSSDDQTAGSAV